MNTHKMLILTLAFLTLMGAGLAQAHTELVSSSPASDEHLETPPQQLELEFGDRVRLMRINLTTGDGERVRVDFRPSNEANSDYRIELPTLEDGHYELEWRAMADDGHTMTGGFSFHLGGNAEDHKSREDSGSSHEGHH